MMARLHQAVWVRRIRALLEARAQPRKLARWRQHITDCARCRTTYERELLAERALGAALAPDAPDVRDERVEPLAPTALELRRGAALAITAARRKTKARSPSRAVSRLALASGIGLSLALSLVAILRSVPDPDVATQQPFAARSSGPASAAERQVGMRVFRARPPAEIRELYSLDADGPHAPLLAGDDLVLTLTNLSAVVQHVLVVAVDEELALNVLHPALNQTSSARPAPLPPGTVDRPAHPAYRIAADRPPGLLRVVAIFGAEPPRIEIVQQALAASRERGTPIAKLRRLPLPEAYLQDMLLLRVGGQS